jgi:hypothetical protein
MSNLYNIEDKGDYMVYTFDGLDLKIKSFENEDSIYVYIKYKEYNPLLSILLGDFATECKLDSVEFETHTESRGMYAIVTKEHLVGFIKEVYFFIMENKSVLDRVSNEKFGWEI